MKVEVPDYAAMDDAALLDARAGIRGKLFDLPEGSAERISLQVLYDAATVEFDKRARAAWSAAAKR